MRIHINIYLHIFIKMSKSIGKHFRLLDFHVYDHKDDDDSVDSTGSSGEFHIQIFGLNERGETCSLIITDYQPFFYIKVGDDWTIPQKGAFISHLKEKVGKFYENSILDVDSKLIKRKKLYGFDGGKQYNFMLLHFANETTMKKAKYLWYTKANPQGEYRLNPDGYEFTDAETGNSFKTILYEAQIPPLLRLFHIKEISPSGWIEVPAQKIKMIQPKTTYCDFEFSINYKDIIPLPLKETIVPYKICSFDILYYSSAKNILKREC